MDFTDARRMLNWRLADMELSMPYRILQLFRFGMVPIVLAVVAGCASVPESKTEVKEVQESHEGIYFVENQDIDPEARQKFDAALGLLNAGEYKKAIIILEKVTEISQNNSAPHVNLAKAYIIIGDYENAEATLDNAMRINPDHPVTLHELALLYRKTGRYEESRDLYESLVERYPEFMPARRNLGILCELYLDDAHCALAQYRSYINENPEEEDVKLWILGLERRLGH
jgi:tetratricopeptide (TPR) repeat protein